MYPNDALIEVLAPAYEPCRHMPVCGGRCRQSHWEPANGHMPRGFLGATGELDEIELVIVLAEPGDPKGTEKYLDELAPSDTVRHVVDFVHETYVNQEDRRVHGKVQRVIRWFLDHWFRGINFEGQLRRVWITQARLCSRGQGSYTTPFYQPCGDAYLAAQLQLLPNVPIIAFGEKAEKALQRLDIQATRVPHPSERKSNESKCDKWKRATANLQNREDPAASTCTGTPRRDDRQWPNSSEPVHPRERVRVRPQHREGAQCVAIDELPEPVAAFLRAAAKAGYEVRWWNRQNISLLYDGRYLGGWNYKAEHWYVRATALGERSSLPHQHGFEPRRNGTLWQRSGKASPKEATDAFHAVIKDLEGVTFTVSD